MSLATLERYDRSRVMTVGEHATVLGASVGGLLAARVLADAFERVTVIERDRLDDDTGGRRGAPQARHPHALLTAGQKVMEQLLPGFSDDLVAAGALVLDFGRDFAFHLEGDFLADGPADMPMYFASRPLIEAVLRARVTDHDAVTVAAGCQVTGLVPDGDAVGGVQVLRDGERYTLSSDLTVDATGRGSQAASWLERLGYPPPAIEQVHVDVAYRTCQIKRPPDDRRMMLLAPCAPRTRVGVLAPVEDDRWLVTVGGLHGDHPPGDFAGMREFAGTLPVPAVRDALDEHALATPEISHYRFPAQTRHRYDRLDRLPGRLVSIGDSIASFNPIYGQGMSVAALEALVLHHVLADHGPAHLAEPFYARTGDVVEGAWNLAAGADFMFPQTRGDKPRGADVINRYISRLQRRAQIDGQLADTFRRVASMELPPTAVFRPRTVWQVLRSALKGAA